MDSGAVNPVGNAADELWRCGGRLVVCGADHLFDSSASPIPIVTEVKGFESEQYVSRRES